MKFRYVIGTMLLSVVTIAIPQKTVAQNSATELVAAGLRQLEGARTAYSDEAYRKVEETFTKALGQDSNNPQALIHRGEAKMARVGILAAQAKFGPAGEMAQTAMADMDRAVSLAPNNLEVRLTRGFMYAAFPPYYNKVAIAREDLETATHDPQFADLSKDVRSHVLQALGVAYTNLSDLEKALDSFRSAIEAAPDSRFGKDARERMKTLASSGVRPDRFPNISSDMSPLVVALSITFSGRYASLVQPRMQEVSKAVAGFSGFLGAHLVASMDKPGMYIIFTWWKDKHAASAFYYSDLHQSWMSGRGQAFTGATAIPSPDAIPTQVSVEVFSGLAGGVQINGGLIPSELFSGSAPANSMLKHLLPPRTSNLAPLQIPVAILKAALFGAVFGPPFGAFTGWLLQTQEWERMWRDPAAWLPHAAWGGIIYATAFYSICAIPTGYARSRVRGRHAWFIINFTGIAGAILASMTVLTVLGEAPIRGQSLRSAIVMFILAVSIVLAIKAWDRARFERALAAERAQSKVLQSQINPHFFFNTLNTISSLIPVDSSAAQRTIGLLADMSRYAFAGMQTDLVPLARELEFARDYLEIEKIRVWAPAAI